MPGTQILLIGGAASRLCLAGGLARDLDADIRFADNAADGMAAARDGCDLILIEVSHGVHDFVRQLRADRVTVPVLACGVAVPAEQAVAAVRAGARDFLPMPPRRESIAAALAGNEPGGESAASVDALVGRKMDDVERALILETLQRCNGNRTAASALLGISVRTMRNKLRTFSDHGIAVPPAAA